VSEWGRCSTELRAAVWRLIGDDDHATSCDSDMRQVGYCCLDPLWVGIADLHTIEAGRRKAVLAEIDRVALR